MLWPDSAPPRYGYLVAHDGPPEPRGLIADIVVDGAGVFLAATTAGLAVRVRLARAAIPDLPVVPTGVTLVHGPIDGSLWDALVQRARAAMPHEVLLAIVAREPHDGELFVAAAGSYTLVEPQLDEAGTGDWQPQQASGCAVRATPIPDAVAEIHSHHTMPAYFSGTDDRDETARRIYGVVGRLDAPTPELALRVATGCKPHAVEPVPFAQVFAGGPEPFRDIQFSDDTPVATGAGRVAAAAGWRGRARPSLMASLLLAMADDIAAIREELEARRAPDARPAPFWMP